MRRSIVDKTINHTQNAVWRSIRDKTLGIGWVPVWSDVRGPVKESAEVLMRTLRVHEKFDEFEWEVVDRVGTQILNNVVNRLWFQLSVDSQGPRRFPF